MKNSPFVSPPFPNPRPFGSYVMGRMGPFALLLASALATGCHRKNPASPAAGASPAGDPKMEAGQIVFPQDSPQLSHLQVKPAEVASGMTLRFNGRLTWNDNFTARVFSPFSGRVVQVWPEIGETVTNNSPLALLLSPDFGQAQAEARRAQTDQLLAERNATRLRELAAHGAAAVKDLSAAEADLARAQSEVLRTSGRLALYGANADSLDNTYTLRAAMAGVVVDRNLAPGQELRADQMLANSDRLAAPQFIITDPTHLWVQLDVGEADVAKLRPGQVLQLRTSAQPDRTWTATVEVIADALDPITRTARVRASVANLDRRLKAEMLVSIETISNENTQAAAVDVHAVFLQGEKYFLFTETARGRFTRREVHVAPGLTGQVRVLDGLVPGERVVVDGAMLLEQIFGSEGT